MSAMTLRKSRTRSGRWPWVLRSQYGRAIRRFRTFDDAIRFLRAQTSAAQY